MANRSDIDWDAIRVDFRLGTGTMAAIAEKHGVAYSNLRRRAKQEKWQRDCREVVEAAAERAIEQRVKARAQAIGDRIGAEKAAALELAVEEAVITASEVIEQHRREVRLVRHLIRGCLKELQEVACCAPELHDDLQVIAAVDPARAALISRALGLKNRADTLDRLASAMAKVTPLERQAWGLDKEQDKSNEIDELLKRVHVQRLAKQREPAPVHTGAGPHH